MYKMTEFVASGTQLTSTTHFSCSSKCRRTSLYKSYHRVFDFSNQKARVRAITFRRLEYEYIHNSEQYHFIFK